MFKLKELSHWAKWCRKLLCVLSNCTMSRESLGTASLKKIHELTSVALEIGLNSAKVASDIMSKCDKFEKYDIGENRVVDENTDDEDDDKSKAKFYRLIGAENFLEPERYDKFEIYIRVTDSSICFILKGLVYRKLLNRLIMGIFKCRYPFPLSCFADKEILSDVRKRRDNLKKCVLGECKEEENQHDHYLEIGELYRILGNTKEENKWDQCKATYSFTSYVLEYDNLVVEEAYPLIHALAYSRKDESSVSPEAACKKVPVAKSRHEKLYDLKPAYFDPYLEIVGMASWSSFILATNSQKEEVDEALRLAISSEANLQTLWNKIHFFAEEAKKLNKLNEGDTLENYQNTLENILRARQNITEVTDSEMSGRERRLNEYLAETSRIQDEISSLTLQSDILSNRVGTKKASKDQLLSVTAIVLSIVLAAFAPFDITAWKEWSSIIPQGILILLILTVLIFLWKSIFSKK